MKSLGLNCLQSLMTKFGNCKRVLGNQRLIPLNHNTCHIDKSSGFWFYQLLVHYIRNEDVNNTEYYIFQWQLQCIIPRLEQMLPIVLVTSNVYRIWNCIQTIALLSHGKGPVSQVHCTEVCILCVLLYCMYFIAVIHLQCCIKQKSKPFYHFYLFSFSSSAFFGMLRILNLFFFWLFTNKYCLLNKIEIHVGKVLKLHKNDPFH